MRSLIFLFSILAIGTFSCSQGPENSSEKKEERSERDSLFKEVMRIHDAVMPKMADINRTKRGLNTYVENNQTLSDSAKTIIFIQMTELKRAEEAMNNWMRDFVSPKSSDPDSMVMDYLGKEEIRISEVSDFMLKSLENGKKMLNDLKNK